MHRFNWLILVTIRVNLLLVVGRQYQPKQYQIPVHQISQTNISAVWDAQLPQYTLRWQENGFIYELRTLREGSPSQSDLIAYAIGLK